MQYLLLIYGNEESFGKMTKAEQEGVLKEYGDFTKGIAQSGHYRGGNELAAISTATRTPAGVAGRSSSHRLASAGARAHTPEP